MADIVDEIRQAHTTGYLQGFEDACVQIGNMVGRYKESTLEAIKEKQGGEE